MICQGFEIMEKKRIKPIVAERDDMIGRSPSTPRSDGGDNNGSSGQTTGMSGLWKFMVLVAFFGLGGAAGLGWMQYQDLATKHSSLLQRFELLESRLSSTDESVIQSGAAMQVTISKQGDQLKKHWSEIKKLWGVTNDINKGKIEKNQKDISFLASNRNTLEESVNKDSKKLATLSANYLGMAADVEALAESMRNQSDGLNRINSSVALINQRIKNNAEGIESMEAFRRQINQKIYALEQRSGATLTQTGSN
jgi:methyl-accepting chemotaxis protein